MRTSGAEMGDSSLNPPRAGACGLVVGCLPGNPEDRVAVPSIACTPRNSKAGWGYGSGDRVLGLGTQDVLDSVDITE